MPKILKSATILVCIAFLLGLSTNAEALFDYSKLNNWSLPWDSNIALQLSSGYNDSYSKFSHNSSSGFCMDFPDGKYESSGVRILAPTSGKVIFAGWDNSYGFMVKILSVDGFTATLAHLASLSVSVGQNVTVGSFLGFMGKSGNATGIHIHFEIGVPNGKINRNAINKLFGFYSKSDFSDDKSYGKFFFGGNPFTPPISLNGDINNDGALNVLDAIIYMKAATYSFILSPDQWRNADFNGDGLFNTLDVKCFVSALM